MKGFVGLLTTIFGSVYVRCVSLPFDVHFSIDLYPVTSRYVSSSRYESRYATTAHGCSGRCNCGHREPVHARGARCHNEQENNAPLVNSSVDEPVDTHVCSPVAAVCVGAGAEYA